MTVEREALEEMVNVAVEFSHDADHIMNAVDDFAASERLDEHVKTCEAVGGVFPKDNKAWRHCGDKWHCERAPIKERS